MTNEELETMRDLSKRGPAYTLNPNYKTVMVGTNYDVSKSVEHGSERRRALIDRHIEIAEHWIGQQDNKDQVVMVFDAEKEGAAFIASACQKADVEKIVADGMIPATVIGIPRWEAYKLWRNVQKKLHRSNPTNPETSLVVEQLRDHVPGRFFLMAISGGKTVVPLDVPGGIHWAKINTLKG